MSRKLRFVASRLPVAHRRQVLKSLALLAYLPAYRGAWAAPYPATVAAMQSARETESNVYYHYTEFARRAQQEGYRASLICSPPLPHRNRCTPPTSARS